MPLTDSALAKTGFVLTSLLCFTLYLFLALTTLYLSVLPATTAAYAVPVICLLLPLAGGLLYLRYGRPEHPKPLYLFIAVLGVGILTTLIPGLSAVPALLLLGVLSPAVLCLVLITLPATPFLQTLRRISLLLAGVILVLGLCIPAYMDAAAAAAGGMTTGEPVIVISIVLILSVLIPVYGIIYLFGGVRALRSVPSPQSSAQTDP